MKARSLPQNFQQEVQRAFEILSKGGVILYPTDTIWGIGCDATNFAAVHKVYKIKKRVESKSMIILLDEVEKLSTYVKKIPETAVDLINSVDMPLTVIYSNAQRLASNVIAMDNTVAIRIVKEPFCKALIGLFGKPIVSTSANISNEPIAITFKEISPEIVNNVDYVVDLYKNRIRQIKPSTIIRLYENGEYVVVRK
ncbi:MAG: L-threonylcarbamoyladenylate synthase [Bacteroidales bacterium]